MTHYQARCKVTFSVPSDWVRAESEAEASDKIRRLMEDQAAVLLGLRREQIEVVVGKAEEWVTYERPPERAPVSPPEPMQRPKPPRAAPDPGKRHRAPSHKRKWAKAAR